MIRWTAKIAEAQDSRVGAIATTSVYYEVSKCWEEWSTSVDAVEAKGGSSKIIELVATNRASFSVLSFLYGPGNPQMISR